MQANITWDVTPEQMINNLKSGLEQTFRDAVLEAFTRVIQRTPVDTGRAKANWQPAIGHYSDDRSLNEYDKTGLKTIQKVKECLDKWTLDDGIVTLTNTLTYIIPLEYGYSKQAPAGMVRLTVEEWEDIVEDAWAKANSK